jgi:uncharacterized protein (TIGR01777 family)
MRIIISGASGFVGQAAQKALRAQGHEVFTLHRHSSQEPYWDIEQRKIVLGPAQDIDVVINLSGENVASGRWTVARKEGIRQSRVQTTQLLAQFFAHCIPKPKLLLSASAVGLYGHRGEEELNESSSAGTGFLAEVVQDWEAATWEAAQAGIRVVHLRLGMVLGAGGGALAKMLGPFKLGLGGVMGKGQQWMSWISLHDLLAVFNHVLEHEELSGPINAVSPHPVRQRHFVTTLAKLLHRPAILPLPGPLIRLLFGEMGQELFLASTRVQPKKLLESGYTFQEAGLQSALSRQLGR